MRNKGFTLVELMAVLVIIAVLGLIAVPIVSDVIFASKEKLTVEHIRSISKEAETYYRDQQLLGNVLTEVDLTTDELKYNGNKIEKGKVYYNNYGGTYVIAYYNGYCLTVDYDGNISYEKILKEY